MVSAEDEPFNRFVEHNARSLARAAWLLTGNWAAAEDLVQVTLLAMWTHWNRLRSEDAAAAYARRVMTSAYLRSQRRRWVGENPTSELPDVPEADLYHLVDLRTSLMGCLNSLPAKQRASIVLRYFYDLADTDIAAAMGCSSGAVRSYASKGYAKLRKIPELQSIAGMEIN